MGGKVSKGHHNPHEAVLLESVRHPDAQVWLKLAGSCSCFERLWEYESSCTATLLYSGVINEEQRLKEVFELDDVEVVRKLLGFLMKWPVYCIDQDVVLKMTPLAFLIAKYVDDEKVGRAILVRFMICHGLGLTNIDSKQGCLFFDVLPREKALSLVGCILTFGQLALNIICSTLVERSSDIQPKEITRKLLRQPHSTPLKLQDYDWIGFDLDHTLVEYNSEMVHEIIFNAVVKHLNSGNGPALVNIDVNPASFGFLARKGMVLDSEEGFLLQVDAEEKILFGFCGVKPLARDEMEGAGYLKDGERVSLEVKPPRFSILHTQFEQPLGAVVGALFSTVALTKPQRKKWIASIKNSFVYTQSKFCDYGLESFIEDSHNKLITPQRKMKAWLKRAGKPKLFLLTNSGLKHANATMTRAYGKDWIDLFEIVITDAKKSKFFSVDYEEEFQKNNMGILSKGNVKTLVDNHLGPLSKKVLYVGDHTLQDGVYPVKFDPAKWETCIIGDIQSNNVLASLSPPPTALIGSIRDITLLK